MIELKKKETTQSVCFHTGTIIDPRSWSVMGMTAAVTEDPIKLFGTGMKYAISILIRTGHEVEIHCESNHYIFGLTETEFRGKKFEQITCNDVPLPFTTEYGKNWTIEGAYRELVSNCMDEGGIHFAGGKIEGGTSIVVTGESFYNMLSKHNEVFLGDREPICSTPLVDIYEGSGTIFYKGVKVGEIEHARYSYHIKSKYFCLTEDRTFQYEHQIRYAIGEAVCKQMEDKDLMRIFACFKDGFESTINWEYAWGEGMIVVGKEIWKDSPTKMGNGCSIAFRNQVKDATFEHIEMTELQKNAINKATDFLSRSGYSIECPIKLVKNNDENLIAYHYKSQIFLTERSFESGLLDLVVTLFEESRHDIGYDDYSRSFQTYLIKEVIKQSAKNLNEFL